MGLTKHHSWPLNSATTSLKAGNGEKAQHPTKPTAQSCVLSGCQGETAAHFPLAACRRHGCQAENHQLTRKLRKHKNVFLREALGGG